MLHNELCQCPEMKKYLASSYLDQHNNIHIVLDRKKFIKDIIQTVIDQSVHYGQRQESKVENSVLINCCDLNTMCDGLTVQQLRSALLCNHMVEALKQNGLVIFKAFFSSSIMQLCNLELIITKISDKLQDYCVNISPSIRKS